ncbi:LysR family transcriptional regulator [Allokutzneria albata]|uniref:DNA-binding transcriptional regulator, LysR family n=1 Tax=Allokutzneria albata TaxID=211114 RepID=A0A1G9TLM9_ALLAB|nr:LysR family transcriptional regulator [Allokutzneria albata]SDM48603.1 DNA-binding transcriptional regulator, LysR family [Allokutzneria albata]
MSGVGVELRQLRYFVEVADSGGFGRAAERLHIVQPAVSQQIRRLERELGVRLFDRSTRHVRLTGEGERLLPEARTALAAADRVRSTAEDIKSGKELVLRLGSGRAPGPEVRRVLDELPDSVRVRLTTAPQTELVEAVRGGELDAAFVRALTATPGLHVCPMWTEQLIVALPADHHLADRAELHLRDLADLPVRLAPRHRNPPFHDLITTALAERGIDPPRGPEFTNLTDTLADIAGADPSWTPFYAVGELPVVRRIAFVPLAAPLMTTALVVGSAESRIHGLLEPLRRLPCGHAQGGAA